MIILVKDVKAAGFCASGARKWFDRYGLSWADFVSSGVDAQVFRDLNDAYGNRVLAETEKRYGQR